MGLAHSPRIVTNGLVMCLDAANTKSYPGSGTTFTDVSNHNNNGTLVNAPTFSSNYVALNGTTQRINATVTGITDSNSGDRVAFECLCYGPMTTSTMLMSWGSNKSDIFINNSGIGFNSYNGDVYGVSTVGLVNVWKHWVFNFYRSDYTQGSIFLNGVQQSLSQISGSQNVANHTFGAGVLQIGCGGDNAYYGAWNISLVRVYNRALTAAEVKQNFNAHRGRFGI